MAHIGLLVVDKVLYICVLVNLNRTRLPDPQSFVEDAFGDVLGGGPDHVLNHKP